MSILHHTGRIAVLSFLLLLSSVLSAGTPLTPEQQQWISRADRHHRDGWIYLRITGEPREQGVPVRLSACA